MARKTVAKQTPATASPASRPAATSPKTSTPRPRPKASGTATKPASPAKPGQRALVVGVSGYPAPIPKLPAVAADIRGIARVLASRNGTFPTEGVTVLSEKLATRDQVLAALKAAFTGAKAADTIFVYLAGHGDVEDGAYYYVAYDSKIGRLTETGVPLTAVKRLFDRTASRRVFLWLDFCHSGGITARGSVESDLSAIKREIGVVQGEGKVILAACTPSQSAYEDSKIGHGLFTHALLRGLKGDAKSANGEVTALSLYEFIDREVAHPHQQPTFFGQMTGRIVLTHYPVAGKTKASVPAVSKPAPSKPTSTAAAKSTAKTASVKPTAAGGSSSSDNLVLLDSRIYVARSVNEGSDGKVEVRIAPRNGEEESTLRSLRGDRYSGGKEVNFAFKDQAFTGRVEQVAFQSTDSLSTCTVILSPRETNRSYIMADFNYRGIPPEQMAEMRARILLLDEKPSVWEATQNIGLQSFVLQPLKESGLDGGLFPALYKTWKGSQAEFPKAARLWAVHYLKSSGICDEVLALKLGAVRNGKMSVRFQGNRRDQYSGQVSYAIIVEGTCQL